MSKQIFTTTLTKQIPLTGLAYASNGLCIEAECSIESHLLITHDGGQTWTEVELP